MACIIILKQRPFKSCLRKGFIYELFANKFKFINQDEKKKSLRDKDLKRTECP